MAQGFTIKENQPNLYKIEKEYTTGWVLIQTNLTQEQCKKQYDSLINDGVSPQRIMITRIL
jgi:nitrogen regulatory protein PII-like uncharacterized protein